MSGAITKTVAVDTRTYDAIFTIHLQLPGLSSGNTPATNIPSGSYTVIDPTFAPDVFVTATRCPVRFG
jgi:hypothetical protein